MKRKFKIFVVLFAIVLNVGIFVFFGKDSNEEINEKEESLSAFLDFEKSIIELTHNDEKFDDSQKVMLLANKTNEDVEDERFALKRLISSEYL